MDNDRGEEWVRRRRPKRGREAVWVKFNVCCVDGVVRSVSKKLQRERERERKDQ